MNLALSVYLTRTDMEETLQTLEETLQKIFFSLNGCFLNSTIEEKYIKGVSHSNICSAGVI